MNCFKRIHAQCYIYNSLEVCVVQHSNEYQCSFISAMQVYTNFLLYISSLFITTITISILSQIVFLVMSLFLLESSQNQYIIIFEMLVGGSEKFTLAIVYLNIGMRTNRGE